jgi:hypothetical protein
VSIGYWVTVFPMLLKNSIPEKDAEAKTSAVMIVFGVAEVAG